ncbi:hypothetical protein [Xanthomonas sp. CFBP 7912]|uniref:hypothetical protein n=1 Tax=Xanthomonas sp. CFBP 7912 TaxID=1891621 RepID=UPI001F3D801F|nr:hypothetical protein [Xanthomonas sp. CFBP 7912]
MTDLKVHSVDGKGGLDKECVWLSVLEDIPSLQYYVLCDTTYTDENHISNELRHTFWFPKIAAKKGDWVRLMTKDGKNTSAANDKGSTTHTLYWKLGKTVWNKDGDAAILFPVKNWKTTRA